MYGNKIRLVYFYPLNHDMNYFILLEINERGRKIRYYNSITKKDIINNKITMTRVRKPI